MRVPTVDNKAVSCFNMLWGWPLCVGLLLISLSVLMVGCSQDNDPLQQLLQQQKYQGWQIYRHGFVRMLHPPNHPVERGFDSHCNGYMFAVRRISEQLGMPPFSDSLNVVYYTGLGQGREMTGRMWPHVVDGVVHYWQPGWPGMSITDYMLQRWTDVETRHDVLRHGLRSFFDFGGGNWLIRTQELIDSGLFIPLPELVVDTLMDSDTERVQSAEAGSLISYLLTIHGAEKLKALYESSEPFEQAVQMHLGISMDILEQRWLAFVQVSQPPVSLPTDTSSTKLRKSEGG